MSKISEIIDFNPTRVVKRDQVAPFIDMASLPTSGRCIPEIGYREFKGGGAKFKNGDTLFARITPCLENGKTAKVSGLPDGISAHGSTEFIVMTAKEPNYDENFVYYLARLPEFRCFAISHMEGTSGRQRVSWQALERFEFSFPEKEDRKKAGDVLSAIDDKIELNQRMNETLEGMARAIFKSWFVDFDPVHAKAEDLDPEGMDAQTAALFPSSFTDDGLPEGWTQESVISSAEYINGAAYKDMHFSKKPDAWPVVKIAELKNGISPQTKFTNTDLGDKFKLDTGDILFSWSGSPDTSIDTFIWTGGKGWLNQHIFKVVNKTRAERCFTYWLLKYLKPEFIEVARNKQTTGLGHVTRKDMEWMQYCKPDQPILDLFYETVGLLLDQIENNLIQNQTLSALRDTLLPKLISGELRVDPAADTLKEAV